MFPYPCIRHVLLAFPHPCIGYMLLAFPHPCFGHMLLAYTRIRAMHFVFPMILPLICRI